ncbi:F-box associated interaction domain [Arabidopsis suecica]|uniref:F-box associated interaction domain n=1 Tax=Arabidopsis suecica TaxID=45249 RepID=A0A8T1ZZ70_ARASU|nr:F-box associated interaction domain [Arabidopsis suecica]
MFGILGFSAAMGKRQKQQVTGRPSNSPRENSKEMPIDLLIDIFTRLPLEDVARCRCVSKLWSSILRRRDFTQLFLKISSTRPRILFTFLYKGRRIFYSIPQDLDPDRNNYSSPIIPHYQMHFPKGLASSDKVCPPILGLICNKSKKPLICNPSTGEYMSLPKARNEMSPFFGYDPIDKLFKVLCLSDDFVFQVSTLGTSGEEMTWRMVECPVPHYPLSAEICIDGVLYYLAKVRGNISTLPFMVVCFDYRLERFKFLDLVLITVSSALINYNGKLGVLSASSYRVDYNTEAIELRVLEDADEVKWSKTVYKFPYYWKDLAENTYLYIVGMTTTGEIVLSTCYVHNPFYIFYYNTVKNSVVRVRIDFGIKPLRALKCSKISTFVNHVENVKLMD